jgi:hypothetical protein
MATKAKTIKLNDLSDAIDKAVQASAGKAKIPGGIIMGRYLTAAAAAKVDTKALANDVTKQLGPSLTGFKLTPTVATGPGGIVTVGFIAREIIQG